MHKQHVEHVFGLCVHAPNVLWVTVHVVLKHTLLGAVRLRFLVSLRCVMAFKYHLTLC